MAGRKACTAARRARAAARYAATAARSGAGLVLGFGNSSNLAAAYGVAVILTMLLTTLLAYQVARRRWRWAGLASRPLRT